MAGLSGIGSGKGLDFLLPFIFFSGFLLAANSNSGHPACQERGRLAPGIAVGKSAVGKWSCLAFLLGSFGLGLASMTSRRKHQFSDQPSWLHR